MRNNWSVFLKKLTIKNYKKNLFFLFSFFLLSCSGPKNGNDYQKIMTQATEAINQEKYSEAISLLNELPESDIPAARLKSMAYSGRAGIKTLEIVDIIENNKNTNPGVILKFLAHKYGTTDINDSRKAVELINKINASIESRSDDLNLQYAVTLIYKSSQILLNKAVLAEQGRFSEIWDPCLEAHLLSIDIKEIINSINRAIFALSYANQQLYSHALKIQNDLKVNAQALENELIQITDVNNLRIFIKEKIVLPERSFLTIDSSSEGSDVCPNLLE